MVLLSNGNGISETETQNLASLLYQNNLVDLVLPVMLDSGCNSAGSGESDSDNCPNLINLAKWASPDSGIEFFQKETQKNNISDWNEIPRSVNSPGSVKAVEKELIGLR